jgi:hypothetical protein
MPHPAPGSAIDFKSWHFAVRDTFESRTGFGKGFEGKGYTSFYNVFNTLASFSEENLQLLFEKAEAQKNEWDKLFIIDLFIQGESAYKVTAILLYKKSKYRGFSYADKKFYPLKNTSKFKVWKVRPSIEYLNDGYTVISEFDKNYNNIHNSLLIGVSNYEVAKKILMIFDDRVFD